MDNPLRKRKYEKNKYEENPEPKREYEKHKYEENPELKREYEEKNMTKILNQKKKIAKRCIKRTKNV